ncbi:hypothetical protein DM49_3572 [Burkholderia mallei]|nr:hypothetical protein DM49_3572 [Burkholderia mallei]
MRPTPGYVRRMSISYSIRKCRLHEVRRCVFAVRRPNRVRAYDRQSQRFCACTVVESP